MTNMFITNFIIITLIFTYYLNHFFISKIFLNTYIYFYIYKYSNNDSIPYKNFFKTIKDLLVNKIQRNLI